MKANVFAVISLTALAAIVAYIGPAYGQPSNETAPIFVRNIPAGYRDWRLVSVAHEEGSFNSFAAVLGNDVAIKAYREGTLRSRTAQSSRLCITATPHRRKT